MRNSMKTLTLAAAIVGVSATTVLADKVLLKVPFAFNPKLPNITTAAAALQENLPAIRDDIKVKIYAPGKLVPAFEILDAVSTGKVNAGFAISAYWAGKIPAASIFSAVPFGPNSSEILAWYRHGNGSTLHQEMYDQAGYNVHPVMCGMLAPAAAGWFQKEINSIEDFQGVKIRSIGLGARVLQKVGASTSSLPVAEIYPALEKGAIDAVDLSGPAVDSMLGLPKIAKYNYYPGWQKPSIPYELLINGDTWDAMSDAQKTAVETVCGFAIAATIAEGEAVQFGPMNAYADSGVEVRQLPTEVLAGLKSAWEEVAVEMSAQDETFKKVYDDLQAFRADYAIWGDNSVLPRN